MAQAVKRACDACHRRKVKCDGVSPCRNCSSAQLSCTYHAIPQKKGPKGSRAKVISELRETQRQTSLLAKVQNRMNGINCSSTSANLTPTPGLLTGELVKEYVQFFFDNMYTQIPILDRQAVEQQMYTMEQNRDTYCLMTSLCAFVMLQPGMSIPTGGDPYNFDMAAPGATIVASQILLDECLKVRKGYEYLDSITLDTLATNFFIFGCYFGLELQDKAWYSLREATTMIHMVELNKEEQYVHLEPAEQARRRRLYALYFMTERAYAIQRQRPLTLQATINLPTINDDPADQLTHQLKNFVSLVNMYQHFDDVFTATWNKTRGHLTAQYITGLQKQLNEVFQSYVCRDPNVTNLGINQQWLRSFLWQITNAGNNDEFPYPAEVARQNLMTMASQFPSPGLDILGSGMIEKLIEMTITMIEYLSMQPRSRDPFAVGPNDHLEQLLTIVVAIRNCEYRFLPLLLSKINEILPRQSSPMLQNAPENPVMANVDIFDGFGNAGMAQPPMQMSMDDYERKYSIEEYEKKYAMDMNNGTPESVANSNHSHGTPPGQAQVSDMNGNFVSSPGVISPGMDYQRNINFPCAPDMVISPLGNPGQSSLNAQPGQHQQMSTQSMGHNQDGLGQHQMSGMHGMRSQQMNTASMAPSHPMTAIYGIRQPQPQRQGSFQMPGQMQMRTVGDFHGLQRAGSEVSATMGAMNPMGSEMDLGGLR